MRDDCDAVRAIVDTHARTIAGLAIKAEVSTVEEHLDPFLIASIIVDIASIASAA